MQRIEMPKSSAGVIRKDVKLDLELTDPKEAQKAKIRTEYINRKEEPHHKKGDTIGDATAMRKHILSMSLFPNIYNHSGLMHSMGS